MTNLKQARIKLGITAIELSRRIGVSRQNISLAEKKDCVTPQLPSVTQLL